jgi:CDP-diglyceride synthetase
VKFDLKALNRGEVIATVGGLLLALSVFLAWFSLGNQNTRLNSCLPHTDCSGWHSLSAFRYLILLAAISPAILAWVIARGHALAWPRGELTAVVAVIAIVLTLFRGVIDPPGSPPEEINVTYGFFVALVGGLLILAGSVWRSQESATQRKPPGVL